MSCFELAAPGPCEPACSSSRIPATDVLDHRQNSHSRPRQCVLAPFGARVKILRKAAEVAGRLPGGARALSHVPFAWRKGREFGRFTREAEWFEALDPERRRDWILQRIRRLVAHAEANVPFYRDLYARSGFSAAELRGFDDIRLIPVVTKADLREVPLEERCAPGIRAHVSNTGGTSGQPLSFMVEPALADKEWAYIYRMWSRRGYRPGFLKLRFGGANLGDELLRYVPNEGEFLVNTYAGHDRTCPAIASLLRRNPVHYLHGYPSIIHGFARHCRDHFRDTVVAPLRRHLRGILLGSESPAPCYRETIEEVFGPLSISWYGHTEKAVLAGEDKVPYQYEPFQGYGFVEAVDGGRGGSQRLVATNYHGYASPFIRYDTGDLIEPVAADAGLLRSFRIAEGRVGDVVLDARGREISLTALIFGRHHPVFNRLRHLQVAQPRPGEVLLIATGFESRDNREAMFWQGFDATGVDIRFRVRFVDAPHRTASGKVPLKVTVPAE